VESGVVVFLLFAFLAVLLILKGFLVVQQSE
jgi:hypothetical protein